MTSVRLGVCLYRRVRPAWTGRDETAGGVCQGESLVAGRAMTRAGGCRCPHGWLNRDGALACSSELTVTNGMKGDTDSSGPSLTIPVVNWDHAGQLQGSRKTCQQKVPGGRELSLRCQGPCWSFLNPPRLVSRQPEWQRPLSSEGASP